MKFGPAVNEAIQLLLDQGFLAEDGTVVLSITGKNGKLLKNLFLRQLLELK